MEAVQRPHVARVLERSREGVVQAEVGAVDGLRLGDAPLFEQEGAVGVAGRLHPAPGLVVGEVVVQLYGAFQGREGGVELTFAVGEFAVQHRRGDGQDVGAGVVEEHPGLGDPGYRLVEQRAFALGLGDAAEHGAGDTAGVVEHRGRHAVQARVGGQREVQDLGPAAEADQDVDAHREEGLQPVGHGRALHPQQFLRDRLLQPRRGLQGGLRLAQEHRSVDLEVVVVRAVERVEVHRAGPLQGLLVGGDRGAVVRHDPAVVAAQHLQVRGHVQEMPGVRHQAPQPVRHGQGQFGRGRHLHEVDVEVQDARVGAAGGPGQRPFQHGAGLAGAGAGGGLAGAQVPQLPGREVHQRVRVQGGHVRVVRGEFVDGPHAVGVRRVPHRAVLGGLRLRVAGAQGTDQGPLHDGGPGGCLPVRRLHGRMGALDGPGQVPVVEELPGLVVVGAQRVRDAPVGHRAVRVGGGRLLEAGHGLLVMKGVRPHQAAVEPELGLGGVGADGPAVGAEVVVLHTPLLVLRAVL